MTEFLFIPSASANGEKTRIRLNDIPRLFCEGIDEPELAEPFAGQSLWQKMAARIASAFTGLSLRPASPYPAYVALERFPDPQNDPSLWQ